MVRGGWLQAKAVSSRDTAIQKVVGLPSGSNSAAIKDGVMPHVAFRLPISFEKANESEKIQVNPTESDLLIFP